METQFIKWLEGELKKREWRLSDLARRAGLDTGSVSRILSGTRNPGPDVCQAIAKALGEPPVRIFRLAGLLPPSFEESELTEEMLHYFGQLSSEDQERALAIVRALVEQGAARGRGL